MTNQRSGDGPWLIQASERTLSLPVCNGRLFDFLLSGLVFVALGGKNFSGVRIVEEPSFVEPFPGTGVFDRLVGVFHVRNHNGTEICHSARGEGGSASPVSYSPNWDTGYDSSSKSG